MSRTIRRAAVVAALALGLAGLSAVGTPTPASGQAGDGFEPFTLPEGYTPPPVHGPMVHPGSTGSIGAESTGGATTGGNSSAEAAGGGSAESVIGADGRVELTDTTLNPSGFPSRAMGQLVFHNSDPLSGSPGDFICTGWLIDANTLLTAGHCAFDPRPAGNDVMENIVFFPGRYDDNNDNNPINPYGSCDVDESTIFSPSLWRVDGSAYNDFSVMHLQSCTNTTGNTGRIGDIVGFMGYFAVPGRTALAGKPAIVRGYPGDKPFGTLWSMGGQIAASQKKMVFYPMDTFGGQSGSPVYQPNRPGCASLGHAGPCGMAIHAYGVGGSGPGATNNGGPRITTARYPLIVDLANNNGV